MNTHIETLKTQAQTLKNQLLSFNEAAELKNAAQSFYREIRDLLRKAHPHLNFSYEAVNSESPVKWKFNVTQLTIEEDRLVFAAGEKKGEPVKDHFLTPLEIVTKAPPRSTEPPQRRHD